MKFLSKYKRLFIITLLGSVTMSPLLTSCGSSGDTTMAGIGGTGITQGKITGFGSIFVNGIEFDTNQSQFVVDGDTALTEADLSIGMVVRILGSVDSNGLVGTANNVKYDDEIQGPIASITAAVNGQKSFVIFDKSITIDESSTSFNNTNFTDITDGDIVEISGFKTSDTEIEATFVKKTGDFNLNEEVELKGTISSLSSSSFTLAGATINFDSQTEIEAPGGILSNGLFVEVKGNLASLSPIEILAEKIEVEDDAFEDGDEVSLQGVISNFMDDSDFEINGQTVNASGADRSPGNLVLDNGLNVEVEGEIVNGVLIAEEVELREGDVEIKARVFSVDINNKQFTFEFESSSGTILVTTDNQTEFEDETSSGSFSLSQVMIGNFIKIEGIDTGSEIIANQVKRLDPAGEDEEIQGIVEDFTDIGSVSSITLFGIIFDVDNVTNPGFDIGGIVEIKDEGPIFGKIDQIELEN